MFILPIFADHPKLLMMGAGVFDVDRKHPYSQYQLEYRSDYEIFNLGTGKGVSVLEMIRAFEAANNLKLNYTITDRRTGDVEKVWADTSFANTELGWVAKTPLADTLRSAWNWENYYRKEIDI